MLLDQNITETKLEIDQQRADELAKKINSIKYLSCKNWATLKTVKTNEGPDTHEYHEYQVPFDYLSDAVELDSIRLQYRNNPDFNLDSCKIKYRVISAKTNGSIERWYDIGGLHYTGFTAGDWEYFGPDGRFDDSTLLTRLVFTALDDEVIQKAIYLDGGFRLLDKDGNMFPGKLILSPYPVETSNAIIYPVDHIKMDVEQ